MAGTFPGVCNTQQNDTYGKPLAGAQLYVYIGGSSVLASTYQDIGLSILAANPLQADPSGRIPLFFVADGTYRVRLVDSSGSIADGGFDYPQVPSIGASSSGGGGSAVDPTTVLSTGDIKAQLLSSTPITGFIRLNGRTIGSSTSGASERANADVQPLFLYLWNNFLDALCPVSTGRGANAAADWAANKTITLPDLRGRALFGVDDMGNAAANRFAGGLFVIGNSITGYSSGGEASHVITIGELAAHTHVADVADPGHFHDFTYSQNTTTPGANGGVPAIAGTGLSNTVHTQSKVTGITVANESTGSSTAHNTMPPFVTVTWYMKL